MIKNALIWTMVVAALSVGTVAQAQSMTALSATPVEVTVTPLRDSAQRSVAALAKATIASQPAAPRSNGKQCVKGLAIGTAGGAAVGFGSAFWLLMSSGGSDSAGAILKGFTLYGATMGLMIGGTAGCK